MSEATGADIEIIERVQGDGDHRCVVPNTVRINGQEVLMPADAPIDVSSIQSDDAVTVTLTLFCRSLTIKAETEDTTVARSFSGRVVHVQRDSNSAQSA